MGKKKVFYLDPDERKWTMEDLGLHMYDFQDLALMNQKIEGTFLAKGRKIVAWTDPSNHCPECLERLKYNDEYDSTYCKSCNEWQESLCDDPTCEHCSTRPNKPSEL
ncbi:hypothetical protein [Sporosarcina sp. FA9]|uniref:hypothetical protein n=1 Tax=Sporosarcina sp. FA9 TaxID=3413030 RepID=UPI003F65963F